MEFYNYLSIIRRRWLLVVITVVVALIAAWVITPREAQYKASSTIYVGNRVIDYQGEDLNNNRQLALTTILATFSLMLDSEVIAAEAIQQTGVDRNPETIVKETTVTPVFQLLNVSVTDPDPVVARDIANALAAAFIEQVQDFEGPDAVTDTSGSTGDEGELPAGLPAQIFEQASLPTSPEPSGLLTNLLLAFLFGLVASCLLAFALEYLDLTVRSSADAERRLDLPVLGIVPLVRREALGPVHIPRVGTTPGSVRPAGEEPVRV